VRAEEYEEAGAVTALAYREFGPRGDEGWDAYFVRLADVAGRDRVAPVYVAVEDGTILGTLTLELSERIPSGTHTNDQPLEPDQAHIRMLGVHPDARRRGVAAALMARAVDESKAAGKTRLTLNTSNRMEAAQKMYAGLGFNMTGDQAFDDGFRLLTYAKQL
jgi:ribosomal protein S18 acetylase RimI-like enzyme